MPRLFKYIFDYLIIFTQAPKVTYAYDGYNRLVAIKVIPKTKPTKELEILMYLNSEPLRSSPENHTIPLLAEFPSEHADWIFFIMPAWRMIWENGIIVFQIDDYFNLVVQSLEVRVWYSSWKKYSYISRRVFRFCIDMESRME